MAKKEKEIRAAWIAVGGTILAALITAGAVLLAPYLPKPEPAETTTPVSTSENSETQETSEDLATEPSSTLLNDTIPAFNKVIPADSPNDFVQEAWVTDYTYQLNSELSKYGNISFVLYDADNDGIPELFSHKNGFGGYMNYSYAAVEAEQYYLESEFYRNKSGYGYGAKRLEYDTYNSAPFSTHMEFDGSGYFFAMIDDFLDGTYGYSVSADGNWENWEDNYVTEKEYHAHVSRFMQNYEKLVTIPYTRGMNIKDNWIR